MKNIISTIARAITATNEPVKLLVEPTVGGFSVALVNVDSDETITMESDWKMDLACGGNTLEEAMAELDQLCAEDEAMMSGII